LVPLYNNEDFSLTSDGIVGYDTYSSCVPYSYNYEESTDVYKAMYGIFCPILNDISSARTSLIHANKFTMPSIYGRNINGIEFSLSSNTGKIV